MEIIITFIRRKFHEAVYVEICYLYFVVQQTRLVIQTSVPFQTKVNFDPSVDGVVAVVVIALYGSRSNSLMPIFEGFE